MKKKDKKSSNASLVAAIIIFSILLLPVIGIFIWDLVSRIKRGWNGNDTISLSFFTIVAIAGIITILSLHDYLINNNKEIVILNNEIYRTFIAMEENGTIKEFENAIIKEENSRLVDKINSITRKRNDFQITLEDIDDYFTNSGLFKGKDGIVSSIKLSSLYEKIKRNKSYKYERLYRTIHNGEIIKEHKFPLFQFISPLLLAFIGFFVSLYQAMSNDGSIQDPLLEYIKLFGLFVVNAIAFSFFTLGSLKEGKIEEKKQILSKLKKYNN